MALQLRLSKPQIYQTPKSLIKFFSTATSIPESTTSSDEETTTATTTTRDSSLRSIFKGVVESNRTAPKQPPPSSSLFLDGPKDFEKKVESYFGNNSKHPRFNDSPTVSGGHYPKISVREGEENSDVNDFRNSLSKLHTIKEDLFSKKKKNRFRDNNNSENWLSRVETGDPFESLGEVVKVKRNGDVDRKELEVELEVEGAKAKENGERAGLCNVTSGDKLSSNVLAKSSSEVDNEGKGKIVRWSTTTDNILLDTLIDQATEGKKHGDAWEDKVWKVVADAISEKTHKEVSRKQIDNRLSIMRSEYRAFHELKENSGFRWCPIKQNLAASDEQWNEFLAVDRANSKYKRFRDRGPKWDYVRLGIIFNEDYHSQRKDDSDKDNSEGTSDEKVSLIGMLKAMIREMTNTFVDKYSKSTSPLTIGVQLHEELMKMDGFSADYLDRAFELLMRDIVGTRIFLIRNATYRKKMLESMRQKIGDI